ncbi:putative disease resistance protein At4g10780 [Olea europaea var. sylvestris]|uniref:putative disease resistance protein At4g10780 n=1 Tax=Olea europaea var. sylvestris TaxID=158386 RepID=UPI000C1D5FD6|nr:putative disease resistance protein At4g10780 [Olea europaea var. sylvestris]
MAALDKMVKNVFNLLGPDLEENTNTLQRKIELLTIRKDDVHMELQYEAYSDGKKRKREVEEWLINVEDIITEFETLKEQVQCCKVYTRQKLTEQVEIMTNEVTELLEQSYFPKGLFHEGTPSTFIRALLEFFTDEEISIIGLWLGRRVGKTTLSNKLSNESTFSDHVYHVRVSQGSSIYKLQSDIAQGLKLDFSCENDEKRRANILCEAFKRMGRSVLILDGVRKQIDVEKIGIPVGMNGCKLIITSRSKNVCHQMACQRIIKVNSVSEQDDWEPFLKKFGSVKPQT